MKITFELSEEEQKLLDFLREKYPHTRHFWDNDIPEELKEHLHPFSEAGIIKRDTGGINMTSNLDYNVSYLGVRLMESKSNSIIFDLKGT